MGRKKKAKESFESYVSRPRNTCEEIVPEISRVLDLARGRQRKLHHLQSILKHANVPHVGRHMKHVTEFDKSEKDIFHGEVSKRMFREIFKLRDYDLYARRIHVDKSLLDEQADKLLAAALGEEYHKVESVEDKLAAEAKVPDVFDNNEVKILPLTTPLWEIGHEETRHPPIGFSSNPQNLSHSLGNEIYYCYRGNWKNGMMHESGVYLYGDGKTYKGGYKNNHASGLGVAEYVGGSTYEGHWENGRFAGQGKIQCATGSIYEGYWENGYRHGKGRLTLPCGLEYEGDWVDGVPHGRGRMSSTLTEYAYEGSFYKGSICGGGTLITPPPECKRHVRFWPHMPNGMSLPGAVRLFLEEQDNELARGKAQRDAIFGQRRMIILRDYSVAVRMDLHEERARIKKEKQDEIEAKELENKSKLYDAKLKALDIKLDEQIKS